MKEIGTHPLRMSGWIASDPPKMAEAMRKVDKPALVYKVLAAGRKCESEEQKRQAIEWAYQEHQADGRDDYRSLPAIFRPGHRNHEDGARDSGVRPPRHPLKAKDLWGMVTDLSPITYSLFFPCKQYPEA